MSEEKTLQMLKMFAMDFNATISAKHIDLGLKTTKIHFAKIRERIAESLKERDNELLGQLQLDPNFFLSHRPYERFAPDFYKKLKSLAIHFYNENGTAVNVFADVISASGKTLHSDITNYLYRLKVTDKKIIDFGFADYNLNPDGAFNTFLQGELALTPLTIDRFWHVAQNRRSFFNGVDNHTSIFHLKETQWRYNKLSEEEKKFYFISLKNQFYDGMSPDIFTLDKLKYHQWQIKKRSKYFKYTKFLLQLKDILEANPL